MYFVQTCKLSVKLYLAIAKRHAADSREVLSGGLGAVHICLVWFKRGSIWWLRSSTHFPGQVQEW
jgi:hypothetical protein